ncbi:MAG: thiol:disulfide interchange protein [Bdellovibrionales bacterium RIFCSPHIGHO2_01_FULL_40_29]|nr:MAG: thiol:disulfide interchange protein [Bdellovibrionales bacterium RIFCSPHIGHO2_01_FULL_40_29]OFZ35494.1 MAG: thiol:disulfide interchange protein [Bdellovibrionales bacterium RIFCSPHIGHO2_02_FULL_40_15]
MKTSRILSTLTVIISAFVVAACAPSAKQLKDAVEKDPSIVFVAIEKDPAKFIEIVNKAAQDAQKVGAEKAQEDEKKAREAEFANPLVAQIEDGRVIFGNKNAPITIVEYSDFQCPYCSRGFQTMKQVQKEYGDKVRIVFKHLPLDFHPLAMPAAKYFEAIAVQDHAKAEKFHDMVFENQGMLKDKGEGYFKDSAKKLGVDMKKLEADLKDEKIQARINADMEEAKKFNMSGTPGFLINGVSLRGAYPFPSFKEIIDQHLAKK